MSAVVIPFPGPTRRELPVLTERDAEVAQREVAQLAPERLRIEAAASLEIAQASVGTREGLVWEVRAFFCLSRMLDAVLPPERKAEA